MNSQLEKYQANLEDIKERSDAEKLHYYPNLVESLLIELAKKSDYSELIYRTLEDGRKINAGYMTSEGVIYYYDDEERLAKELPYEFTLSAMIDKALIGADNEDNSRIEVIEVDGQVSLCCRARIVWYSDEEKEAFEHWRYLKEIRKSFVKRFGEQFNEEYKRSSYGLEGFINYGWEMSYRPDFIPDPIEYSEWKISLVKRKV